MDLEKAEEFKKAFMPSSNGQLLRSLIGASIEKLVRYSWWSPESAADRLHISESMVFSLTLGPVLMHLDDGRVIGFGDSPPLKSVTIWCERGGDVGNSRLGDISDKSPVTASDVRFASSTIRNVLGKRIVRARILKRRSDQAYRPYEVGVLFECEGSHSFMFAHGIYDDLNSFSVISPEQIMEEIKPELYELQVIEAQS